MNPDAIKISSRPFFFGLFVFKNELFFDKEFLYIQRKKEVKQFPLASIISVQRTYNKVNNREVWELTLMHERHKQSFRFLTNITLSNPNFSIFLQHMEKQYPHCGLSKLTIWTM